MTDAERAAVDAIYGAAKAARDHAQADLDAAERLLKVASALHDAAHEPKLRAIS